jgi:flagellar hook-associated protein 3 FlgL
MAIPSRVTEGSIHTRVLANLQRNMAQGAKIQEQLSSGKQLNRPSDSPTGTITSMELRGETRSVQQHVRNADDGVGWLNTVGNALTQSSALINRTRDLTLQGLNSGATTVGSREALAVEIDNIREQLIGHANSTYLGRPVFGGTTAGEVAYRADGSYAGDAGAVERTVGTGVKVRVDVSGPEAFGADGSDAQLFTVLADISKALRDNDTTALGDGLKNLDAAGEILKGAMSGAGARYNRVEQMRDTAQDRMLTLKSQLSDVEDIDLPKTIMEMQLQQTAYQAALAASAKVIQPSLIDYLR